MKIGIIGIGTVGSAILTSIYNSGLAREIVLIERDTMRSRAAAEDLGHAEIFGHDVKIKDGRYTDLRNIDVVIISAGANQLPDQTRTSLLSANANVISDIVPKIMKNCRNPNLILIVVTNPLDPMVMLATKLSGLPAGQVIGTGTMLDTARLKVLLTRQLGISKESIFANVLGEHGDSSVINWSAISVGGLSLDDFCRQTKNPLTLAAKKTMDYRVKNAAYEIIKGRGATWDGIAAATTDLVRAIANDERRILTVSSVSGGFAMSLPCIVGARGVCDVLSPKLDKAESIALRTSAGIIKRNYKVIND